MQLNVVALSDERVVILVRKCWRANQPPNTPEMGWIFAFKKNIFYWDSVPVGHPSVHCARMVQFKNSWHYKSCSGQYFVSNIMTAGNIFLNIQIQFCAGYDLRRCFVQCLVTKSGSL